MSIVEMRERLNLQKQMLIDQINSKKCENKLKMQERSDMIANKLSIIEETRDKLKNDKEIERKNKKDALELKKKQQKEQREKSLFEVKEKIQNKKAKMKEEYEIFQKKIRDIALQRQFLQHGRDAVEFKQFKQIEEAVERKINDRQNKDLINQLATEKIKWEEQKMKYNKAVKENNNNMALLNNYKLDYDTSDCLNQMEKLEDKIHKKVFYDRSRAWDKSVQDTFQKKIKFFEDSKPPELINTKDKKVKAKQTEEVLLSPIEDKKEIKSDEEEGNEILQKLETEKELSKKEPIANK